MRRVLLGAALSAVFFSGCGGAKVKSLDCAAVNEVSTLRITAKVTHENSENAARAVMLIRRPDALRFEVYGAMNRRIAIAAASDKGCAYYSEGSIRDCGESNGSTNPLIILTSREAVAFLFGNEAALGGAWQFERRPGGRVAKAVKAVGPFSVVVTLGDYEDIGCVVLPRVMRVESRGESFEIEIKGAEPNVEINDGAFELAAERTNP